MCELCDPDENVRRMALDGHRYRAKQLEDLMHVESAIASGRIKPHTDAWKKHESLAKSILRYLVEDWL